MFESTGDAFTALTAISVLRSSFLTSLGIIKFVQVCFPSHEPSADVVDTLVQYWRLLVHHLAFSNSSDLLLAEILLYNVSIPIERMFGTSKFAVSVITAGHLCPLFYLMMILTFFRIISGIFSNICSRFYCYGVWSSSAL